MKDIVQFPLSLSHSLAHSHNHTQSHTHTHTQRVPTLGACAVVLALQLCDQVSLAGFGYDMRHPGARLHYYETLRMDAMKGQVRDLRRMAGGCGGVAGGGGRHLF